MVVNDVNKEVHEYIPKFDDNDKKQEEPIEDFLKK